MKRFLSGLAVLALALSLAACAGPSTSSGAACAMCSSGACKEEGKAMKCCDKHEAGGGCCKKGGTPAGGQEGHQH